MSQYERRKHARYLLHLPIKLHCGGRELSADVINASAGGCLLRLSEPLAPGEQLEASIPALNIPRARLIVVRCQSMPSGYTVAAYFEEFLADEARLREYSDEQGLSGPPVLH